MDPKQDCDFYFRTSKTVLLKHLFDVLKEILSTTTMVFGEDTITIMEIDSTKTKYVHMTIFTDQDKIDGEYICNNPCDVGVNIELLSKALKQMDSKEVLEIFSLKNGRDEIVIRTVSEGSKEVDKAVIKQCEVSKSPVEINDMSYDNQHLMNSKRLNEICKGYIGNDSTIIISSSRNAIGFTSEGNVKYHKVKRVDDIEDEWDVVQRFSADSLNIFTKAMNINPLVSICIKKDHPLTLNYPIGNIGSLSMLLLPQLEDDEE